VESEKNVRISPGKYPCFCVEFMLEENKYIHADSSVNILREEKLRFVFDRGRGRIYWNNTELTKRLCLYTSLRSDGRWYDSFSSAMWEIEGRESNIIKAMGKWLYLPVIQYWRIETKNGNSIEFKVRMRVNKEIKVERLQTNVMLSEKYNGWFSCSKEGRFPDFCPDIDSDWDVIHSELEDKTRSIGVRAENSELPQVKIIVKEALSSGMLNIINSDLYHRARLLQWLDSNDRKIMAGEYLYYEGEIIFKE
jgi:hypothetical protein